MALTFQIRNSGVSPMPRPFYTSHPIIGHGFNTMDWITPERLRERQKRLREEKRQRRPVGIRHDPFRDLLEQARRDTNQALRKDPLLRGARRTQRIIISTATDLFRFVKGAPSSASRAMLLHYFNGNGRKRTLTSFGVGENYRCLLYTSPSPRDPL